jgi:hypothetical protein
MNKTESLVPIVAAIYPSSRSDSRLVVGNSSITAVETTQRLQQCTVIVGLHY